jgi:hypothetical protein
MLNRQIDSLLRLPPDEPIHGSRPASRPALRSARKGAPRPRCTAKTGSRIRTPGSQPRNPKPGTRNPTPALRPRTGRPSSHRSAA